MPVHHTRSRAKLWLSDVHSDGPTCSPDSPIFPENVFQFLALPSTLLIEATFIINPSKPRATRIILPTRRMIAEWGLASISRAAEASRSGQDH